MRAALVPTSLILSVLAFGSAHAADPELAMGRSIEGRFDRSARPSDGGGRSQDYRLALKADQLVAISAKSDDVDPVLILFGPDGEVVSQNDDRGDDDTNALIVTSVSASGTYTVRVNSLGSGEDALGAFTLKAMPISDD